MHTSLEVIDIKVFETKHSKTSLPLGQQEEKDFQISSFVIVCIENGRWHWKLDSKLYISLEQVVSKISSQRREN